MKILYQHPDGTCHVVTPVLGSGFTLEEIIAKDVPEGVPYQVVSDEVIPSDRTYRAAWVADVANRQVIHDMPKARECHKEYMRQARAPLMAALDTAYMRADEKGAAGNGEKATIVAQKQTLRDVTNDPGIAAAKTVEALKQVWPVVLGAKPF